MTGFRSAADRQAALAFFRGRDDAHRLFQRVVEAVRPAGPFELTATRSRVALAARTRFAWCHEANDDGSLWLGFLLPRRVPSPRLRSGRAGGRWSHHAKVSSPADLDGELVGWLREAHAWDVAPPADRQGAVATAAAARRKAPREPRGWTCPRCGQAFARRGQSHSCDRRAVEELFADHPKAVKVTQLVQAHLASLGGDAVRTAATKTQVSFAAQRRFAWVWVPRQAVGPGKPDVPVVSFALRRREQDRRVQESVQPRGGLWMHHVEVPSGRQVDRQLKAWLSEAYATVGTDAGAA